MNEKSFDFLKVSPDSVYGSLLAAKVINKIMLHGKKNIAEKIFYSAIENVFNGLKSGKYEIKSEDFSKDSFEGPVGLLEYMIKKITPGVEVKSRRVGRSNLQVPVPVKSQRGLSLACLWLVKAIRSRSEHTSAQRLELEFSDILIGKGLSIKKKTDVEKMAEANKAFAHFIKS